MKELTFNEYEYKRIDLKETEDFYKKELNVLKSLTNKDDIKKQINLINEKRDYINTMLTLSSIRNTINTNDKFYSDEKDFYDENGPLLMELDNLYFQALLDHNQIEYIKEYLGQHYLNILQIQIDSFNPSIMQDLTTENKLVTKYKNLIASAKIEYNNEIYNLSMMGVFSSSPDRNVRKESSLKVVEFMESISNELDNIFDELVKVRTKIAKQLGFNSFTELGYKRLYRTDYTPKEVALYRKQVLEELVPLCNRIIEKQKQEIGINDLKYYDLNFKFKSGNPKPIGTKDELVQKAVKMYDAISPETKEFFRFMADKQLLDLDTKPGKASGGYCTYIPNYKSPFIFANFNGTSGDVDVLTHEAGHAFNVYSASKEFKNSDVYFPTMDAAEIHSMSMEFFAYPYLDSFFEEETDKYKQMHLTSSILFIPYGVCVDEFQHYVYDNPNITPQQRKDKWRELEKKYTPYKDFDGVDYYERGSLWFRQAHIFSSPFYYIDYTLAQVCAMKFYSLDLQDHNKAWDKYYQLCKLGGTKSFLNLLKTVDLINPFESNSIKKIIDDLKPVLDKYL
ncbi:MAG: M3 family oligoendopeptidase [Anaeroplasmataceae bacterium]